MKRYRIVVAALFIIAQPVMAQGQPVLPDLWQMATDFATAPPAQIMRIGEGGMPTHSVTVRVQDWSQYSGAGRQMVIRTTVYPAVQLRDTDLTKVVIAAALGALGQRDTDWAKSLIVDDGSGVFLELARRPREYCASGGMVSALTEIARLVADQLPDGARVVVVIDWGELTGRRCR